ncbi:hypothetical protein A3F06_02345 [candidate division TM6 bacterium RIFCSPHIGHO2_12_FULL_36_22]|nr:MAG: hypothetical protein A3F06_02345 [candidate division TM6 bacterium RIFCSPHIGHO2_12_FULL_36_22]
MKRKSLVCLGILLSTMISNELTAQWYKEAAIGAGIFVVGVASSELYALVKRKTTRSTELEKGVLIKALLSEYEEIRSERDNLVGSVDELQCFIDELQKLCDLLSNQNEDVQGEKKELAEMVQALQKELELLTGEYKREQEEKRQLAQQLDVVQDTQQEMEALRDMYENANKELGQKVLDERNALISSSDRLQKMMDNLKAQIDEIHTEKTGLVRFFDGLKDRLDTWRSAYTKKATTLRSKRENNQQLMQRLLKEQAKKKKISPVNQERTIDKMKKESRRITSLLN